MLSTKGKRGCHLTNIPDHKLIISGICDVVYIRSGEKIVRHIRIYIRVIVAPRHGSRDSSNVADELLLEVYAGIGVALHLAVAAGPVPGRVPLHAISADAVDCRALRAAAHVHTPKIIIYRVGCLVVCAVLVTELLGEGS